MELKYPPLGIHDEYGNWIFACEYHKIAWWLINSPNDPAVKKYKNLYPEFLQTVKFDKTE